MTRKKTSVAVLFLASLLLVMLPLVALAAPPLPSSFYGTVTLDGQNVPDGTTVVAYVGGSPIAQATTQTFQGNTVYAINVAGDDPATTAVEGGTAGAQVFFAIGNTYVANEVGTWATGVNVSLNLTASSAPAATPTPTPPASATISDQIASIANQLVLVITYNPSDTADPWKIYDPAAPAFASDLPRLQAGSGYWIYSNAATTLTYAGNSYSLSAGWNLLGWIGSGSSIAEPMPWPTATPTPRPTATPTSARTATPTPPSAGPLPSSVADAVARAMPAVVRIEVRTYLGTALGSGFIIDAQGNIVTNNHVVEDSNTATVTLPDGRTFTGTVIGRDAIADIAVVRITGSNLPTVAMGNSDALSLGEDVIAIGYPLGFRLGGSPSITGGIYSALRYDPQMGVYVIQTDAAINPGNSGGPLVNLRGEVVGIITYKPVESDLVPEGISMAISINSAQPIIQRLLSGQAAPAPTATPVPTAQPSAMPNLVSWAPPGWDGAIVASNLRGTHSTDARLTGSVNGLFPTYIDQAVKNEGPGDVRVGFKVAWYFDGVPWVTFNAPPLAAGAYAQKEDESYYITPGYHTIAIVIDPDNAVAESNEQDNRYERTFYWATPTPSTSTPTPTSTPRPTATPTPARPTPTPGQPLAAIDTSRLSPAPVGTAVRVTVTDWGGTKEYEVTVLETVRGERAWNMILDANMFNSPPPPGGEYLLVKARVRYLRGPAGQKDYINRFDFDLYPSEGGAYSNFGVVEPEPSFGYSDVFPGAVVEGWMSWEVSQQDSNPVLVFGADYSGRGGAWFSVTP